MITAAIPGTTASGARAASSGPGFGGYPPVNRASSAGNAKAMRIKAVSPVTPCLFFSLPVGVDDLTCFAGHIHGGTFPAQLAVSAVVLGGYLGLAGRAVPSR